MIYKNEYLATRNKVIFTNLMKRKYPHLKESSISRRYYDCKKELGKQIQYNYPPNEKYEPAMLKMIRFRDMKQYNHDLSRKELNRYGFTDFEVNWLEDEGLLEVVD